MVHLHHEIAFTLAELHLLLEGGAKGIKWVSSRGDLQPCGVSGNSSKKVSGAGIMSKVHSHPVSCGQNPEQAERGKQKCLLSRQRKFQAI